MTAQNIDYPTFKTAKELQKELDHADVIITNLLIQFCDRNEYDKPLDTKRQTCIAITNAMQFMGIH